MELLYFLCCYRLYMKNSKRKVLLSNNVFFSEVSEILNKGGTVSIPVRGNSMLPFIVGGRDKVTLEKKQFVKKGDIVLAWVNGKSYVLHRVYHINGDALILMGDGNHSVYERCLVSDVCGTVVIIERNGRKVYAYSKLEKLKANLWKSFLPFRVYLLSAFRLFGII